MADLGILSELPPELRLQIYSYVLLHPVEELHIVPTMRRRLSPEAMRRRAINLNQRAAEGRTRLPISIKNALLCVSKQISHEASATLYGNHKFVFKTAQALESFLSNIGDNKQHLRHVEVTDVIKTRNLRAIGRISDNLTKTPGLRCFKLAFDVRFVLGYGGSELSSAGDVSFGEHNAGTLLRKLASVARKLLLALHGALPQESEDKVAGVCAVFQLALPGGYEKDCGNLRVAWENAVEACVRGSAA